MNIKIADSWLREYLITKARPLELAEKLSLTSVSVEKVEKIDNDYVYDIEVTSNRLDLMSVIGIAREAFAILPRFGIDAKLEIPQSKITLSKEKFPILIKSDSKIVNRITTVAIDVTVKPSPGYIKERLEASGIRSLNNLIDVTNYVMRETGHPVHVFDYDRLNTSELTIRESKQGEKIITLDKKEHILSTGNIIAVNKKEEIVDLLGVMGTLNSVVTENTKRILLFLDNNEPSHIRKTSMSLGIRSEAAILNEKGVDPELAMATLTRGIELYSQIANGKVISEIYDDYPNKPKVQTITVTKEKIDKIIGVEISLKQVESILISLGFKTKLLANKIEAIVPSFRANDISLQEDIIEEIARVFGYHNLPSILPPLREAESYNLASDNFYWETRIKNTLKYWGFTEIYTYSMIPENLLEGPREEAVK
ncbi:hypothetical protein KKG52_01865, partial [Patescibacteria group bacterium]|nr:hypothetical protein [Patescibacteria group bacterium]